MQHNAPEGKGPHFDHVRSEGKHEGITGIARSNNSLLAEVGRRDGRRLVHRLDCAAGSDGGSLATDADALRLLAQGPEVATTCAICRPEAVLRTLPPPPDDAF
ncbi:DUF6233 domain-containing protein [Streptomyces chrestomyceticus]|uniref:DUF6233 domain-containing protein n=1 Tax=Streptomyces chrestomyceticus TaxID=68185 RepID=UPI0035A883A1